jgi:hypothetical protein
MSKIGHFIYFYNNKSKRSTEWDLMRFIAIKSFALHNPDYVINFYTNKQPSGVYWERASEYCNVILSEPPTEVFSKPLIHPAHASDVFRINLLIEQGGVYCDFDTITMKSFNDLINRNKFLIGAFSNKKITMCNCTMVSPPQSLYMYAWLNMWKGFRSKGRDKYWDELSGKAHRYLTANPTLLETFQILTPEYFLPYSHYSTNELFYQYMPEKIKSNTYSVHLYDSQTHKDINLYNEEFILQNPLKSSYTWLVSQYL